MSKFKFESEPGPLYSKELDMNMLKDLKNLNFEGALLENNLIY